MLSIPTSSLSLDLDLSLKELVVWWIDTDGRFWWIKIKALARNKDWEGLENFAKSKKSPIGYEPFVVCLHCPTKA